MMYKTFLERLSKPRNIYVGSRKIHTILECEELMPTIDSVSSFYKLHDLRPDICSDEEGCHISFLKPKNKVDLKRKREAYRRIANENFGFLSRTPDFINAALTACSINSSLFGADVHTNYSQNIDSYYDFCRKNNIFVTHASINPQIDRSKSVNQVDHHNSAVRIIKHDEKGIIVSGAKMIGTLAAIADEILIFNMPGLSKQDTDYAVAFAIPTTHKNIDIILRKSMLKTNASPADYPYSTLRFS